MRRLHPAIVVAIGVAGAMGYAGQALFGLIRVTGNGSEGFTCTWVPEWGPALALGAGVGVVAGLLFWLALALRHGNGGRQAWLAALAIVSGSVIAVLVVFPPAGWGPPQECPPSIDQQG